MRIAYLGSGSRGNAAIIESADTRVMLDCGFSGKEAERRLERLGLSPGDVHAILVTHEHSDHISGVGVFARKHKLPVWMTPGTYATEKAGLLPDYKPVNCHQAFQIGSLTVSPIPVPHDAKEPCQYVFSDGQVKLGVLTDVGHITPHIKEQYAECDALVLECNHDTDMLRDGPYPYALKQRVGGNYGHLNNQQTAELLSAVAHRSLQWVMAVHVSEKNNTGVLAQDALHKALRDSFGETPNQGCTADVYLADQSDGTPWQEVQVALKQLAV